MCLNTLQCHSHLDALLVRLRILIANSVKYGVELLKEPHQSTVKLKTIFELKIIHTSQYYI